MSRAGENKRGTPKKRTRADSFSQNGNDCDHDQGRKKRDGFRLPPFRSHLTLPFNPMLTLPNFFGRNQRGRKRRLVWKSVVLIHLAGCSAEGYIRTGGMATHWGHGVGPGAGGRAADSLAVDQLK
jgi:hypothetical protein